MRGCRNRHLRRINQHLPEQENIDIDDLEPFGTARGLRSRPSPRRSAVSSRQVEWGTGGFRTQSPCSETKAARAVPGVQFHDSHRLRRAVCLSVTILENSRITAEMGRSNYPSNGLFWNLNSRTFSAGAHSPNGSAAFQMCPQLTMVTARNACLHIRLPFTTGGLVAAHQTPNRRRADSGVRG